MQGKGLLMDGCLDVISDEGDFHVKELNGGGPFCERPVQASARDRFAEGVPVGSIDRRVGVV